MDALENRIKKIAIVTSPIIAAYGVAPIFLLKELEILPLLIAFSSLTILIGLFWWINIGLIPTKRPTQKRYLQSYLYTFLLQTLILILVNFSSVKQNLNDFLLYSILSTIAVNTIILVIINSELLKRNKALADFEIQNLRLANLEAQKQVLLQQLQPHFLFNALSTLKSLINENPEKAEDYSVQLSEFLRYSIHANQKNLVSLKEECEFTKDYLSLQQVRFGNALQFSIRIEQDDYRKLIPILALQTVVENAIKHNSFTEKNPLLITIDGGNSNLTISNQKSPKQIVLKSGIGLKNLKERYSLFIEDGIIVMEEEKSFKVQLKLIDNENYNH